MRLIDADALYNGAMKDEWFRFKERDNNGDESFAYSCAMQRLVEAPTVDAIPVAWLRNVHKNWILTRDDMEFLDWLIQKWKKEQEEKNGNE